MFTVELRFFLSCAAFYFSPREQVNETTAERRPGTPGFTTRAVVLTVLLAISTRCHDL